MRRIYSRFSAVIAGFALVFAPVAALANTRAADSAVYQRASDDDDDDDNDFLLILFGTVATIGAIAIVLSGQSSGGAGGPNQSNGAS